MKNYLKLLLVLPILILVLLLASCDEAVNPEVATKSVPGVTITEVTPEQVEERKKELDSILHGTVIKKYKEDITEEYQTMDGQTRTSTTTANYLVIKFYDYKIDELCVCYKRDVPPFEFDKASSGLIVEISKDVIVELMTKRPDLFYLEPWED